MRSTRPSVAQRGSTTVELAVLFPALLVLVFGSVQAAEWYHLRGVCLAAAEAGVASGRVAGADRADAVAVAAAFAARAGTATDIHVSGDGTTAARLRVQVDASVPRVLPLPGLSLRVSQHADGPRELVTVDSPEQTVDSGR
jgi:Flp pilus assembly protein TadG